MFVPVIEKILPALEKVPGYQTTGCWEGDVKQLLESAHKLPSAHVMLTLGEFDLTETLGGKSRPPSDLTWTVISITENRKDLKTGYLASLGLIDALLEFNELPANMPQPVKPGLTRLDTGYGRLWPAVVQFMGSENGKTVYGIKFYNKKGH